MKVTRTRAKAQPSDEARAEPEDQVERHGEGAALMLRCVPALGVDWAGLPGCDLVRDPGDRAAGHGDPAGADRCAVRARVRVWREADGLECVRDYLSCTRTARLLPLRSSGAGTTSAGEAAPDIPCQEVVARLEEAVLAGRSFIALVAFVTIITAVLSRDDASKLVLGLAAGTVATCWMVITFSFALQYARRDIEQGGLKFPGSQEPVFSDYIYLAIGCSATFGTTDTTIVSSTMRRLVSVHSVLGLLLNTVVVAVLISIIVS